MFDNTLRWLAPLLAIAAALLLPALTLQVPFLPDQSWKLIDFAHPHGHASLSALLDSARQLGASAQVGPGLDRALKFGAAIPAMALAAAVCAVLALLLQCRRWGRGLPTVGVAGTGLACTAYSIGACWWLTRAAHNGLIAALEKIHNNVRVSDWSTVAQNLQAQTRLRPEAALYVLGLAFLVLLLLPLPARRT